MTSRSAGLSRAIAILRLLEAGARVRLSPLSSEFGVTERTIRRDLKSLEAAGVPIMTLNDEARSRGCGGVWWLCR